MTRRMKSFISLLLCICMFVGTLPESMIQAFAEETGTQQEEESELVVSEASELGEAAAETDTEYLDQSVTVDISAASVDNEGMDITNALTGETLNAVVSAYNDNPNYEADATIRIYVKQTSGNSTITLKEIPDEITLSGLGSSDKASAVTVKAKWHEADGVNITVPYLEFSIPSGASAVFELALICPTGYDKSASAQIYATVTTTDEETGEETTTTYPTDGSDPLTFTWTGEAAWNNFTKTASLAAIGVADGEIKADEVDWTFSAKNNTSGSTGVIYTKQITMTDTLTLPEGLSVTDGSAVMASDTSSGTIQTSVSGKTTVGEIQNNGGVVYAIFLAADYADSYTLDSLNITTNSEGKTEITYTITITNPDVTNESFNPVSAISTAIYIGNLTYDTTVSMQGSEMKNTAQLTVYSVMPESSDSYKLYEDSDDSTVTFDETYSLTVAKEIYQVKDGIGNVTFGKNLDTSVGTALSNEKKYSDEIPYVAQGYTVTYQVTVGSMFATATENVTMTDTLPKELTLDNTSIVVTSGDDTLTNGKDYTCTTSTDSTSGKTTLTVEITKIPAYGSVVITYSCMVNENAATANTEIKNTAKVGNNEASATIRTPENGDVKITREIIQRTTTTSNGYTLKIYKDLKTGNYEVSVDNAEPAEKTLLAYFGTTASNISQQELEEAILKVNAGDTIEYLITVENNSLEDEYGKVYESNLFSSVADVDKSDQALASAEIGTNAGGWNYYIAGSSTYFHTEANSNSYYKASVLSETDVTAAQDALWAQCKYSYQDLETKSSNGGINTTYRNGIWAFSGSSDKALQAYTTYHQTTVIQIPGNNEISSASTDNAGYQNLVSSYAYYCTNCYDGYKSEWADYAYFVPTNSNGNVSEGVSITDGDIYGVYVHTPERQIYLNTGTLASTVLDDEDVSKLSTEDEGDGLITELLYESTSSVVAANDYANSGKFFTADESCYVVNYVYLFNDSSEEMNLEDYSLSVVLPDGFEWVGFTYPITESSDVTSSTSYRKYSAVSSSVFVSEYYGSNYDLWVNNTRATGQSISALAYSAGTTAGYYADESGASFASTMSQMEQALSANKDITQNTDNPSNELSCTTKAEKGDEGTITFSFTSTTTSVKPTIAAYNGIVVMYVAKVSDASEVKKKYSGTESTASNAAATFQVYIERKNNTKYTHSVDSENYCMSQISPVIRAQDAASSSGIGNTVYRGLVSNDGNANTVLNCSLDEFYSASSSTVAGGSASRMWSYVSLSMYVETTSVSVTKEVVKNNGANSKDQYSNGLPVLTETLLGYLSTSTLQGGFETDYNAAYHYGYSLLDGLHRTVDGTVTWMTTITNTGKYTTENDETGVSVGAVYDYSAVDYSTLIETVDSPYHLIEIAVPAIHYVPELGASVKITAKYSWLYFELPDADPSDSDAMKAAGWKASEEEGCYYYEVYARNNDATAGYSNGEEKSTLGDVSYISSNSLIMRVTVRCLKGGSVATGVDRAENTDAYQYLIEFYSYITRGQNKIYPLLYTKDELTTYQDLSSVSFYLTFSTDDSIETNYNSFGLVLKDVENVDDVTIGDGNGNGVVEGTDGEATTVEEMHNGAASSSASSGGTITTTYTPYTGAADSPGTIDANAVVVQANDWTDTSYTYGEKTISVLDNDGNVATDADGNERTINTTENGNMVLTSVEAGTAIHGTLKWESVLYQSENYSSVTDLVLYDTYGLQVGTKATSNTEELCGYDVDLDSIEVKLCLHDEVESNKTSGASSTDENFACTEKLKLGEDYEIYYTTAALVTDEHLELTVNSLELAADLTNLENVDWIEYDPNDSNKDGTGAMAFKIKFLENGKVGTIWNAKYTANGASVTNGTYVTDLSIWSECEIYVDYDAVVSDSVVEGTEYPNVLAWTANVNQPEDGGSITKKGIAQDTTAMIFEATEVSYPTLSKTVVDESDTDISSQVTSEEFTYLIFRTNQTAHDKSNLNSESNITGAAAVTIQAGETLTLNDSNLDVLYNNYGDDSAKAFWDTSDNATYYYIVEMDSGNYEEESISLASETNVTGSTESGLTIGSMSQIAEAISSEATVIKANAEAETDTTKKATLAAQANLYSNVATWLKTSNTTDAAYFAIDGSSSSWALSIAGVNKYTAPALVIYKKDTSGVIIQNEVKFQMEDAAGNKLYFTRTSGGYAYVGTASTDSTDVTDLVFNGTTSVTGLPEGTYYLEETSAPEGYVLSTDKTEVTIEASREDNGDLVTRIEKSITNTADSDEVTGSVKLVKVDADTNAAITTGSASFQLYSSQDTDSQPLAFTQDRNGETPIAGCYTYASNGSGETTISTDSSYGTLELSGLPEGTYYLVETTAPDGYLASHTTLADAYEFTISRTESEIEIDFPNTYIQADIVISKTDSNEIAITDNPASFTLTDEDGKTVTFSKGSDGIYTYDESGSVTELATSSTNGTLTLRNLPKGSYTLTETCAPKGYMLSTKSVAITVENMEKKEITVTNETASIRLRIAKTWKYEGRTATYAFSGVDFTLYQVDSDSNTATVVKSGTTNGSGILDLEGLDWSKEYYLYEEVPEGYSASGNLTTVYRDKTSGEINLNITKDDTQDKDGYTAISCIYINMSENLCGTNSSGEEYCTDVNGTWTYTLDVLNVKNETNGGMYASTSYKTISNAKSAAVHEGLEEQTGYSYFYTESDYEAEHYNYVSALKNGDTVTYTLNVSNVSDYEFTGLVLIDRMPEEDDTGVVNSSAARSSQFAVAVADPANMVVTVDGVEVSSELYEVTYSSKVKFTNSDFNGTSTWSTTAGKETKSFRIVFDSSFALNPGQTLVVTYDGVIGDDAAIGELAWNNFAYRYTVTSGSKTITLTPEPPRVGVLIQGESYKVTKEWEDDNDSLGLRPSSVTLQLKKKDSSGNLTDVKNGTVTLTYAKDTSGTEPTESLTATIANEVSDSTVKVEASLDEDGNWICLWTGLPILDADESYVVEEIDTGSTNYVWSVAMEKDENNVESEESAIVTNKLTFTTLNLVKQNSDGDALSGTQFSLERQTDTNTWETVDTVYTIDSNGRITTTTLTSEQLTEMLTTNGEGKVVIAGLIAGTYRITEVKSKSGYTLLSNPLVIKLPVSYTKDEVTSKNIDTSGSDVYLTGDTWYFYNITYTITNTANFTMPSAGQTAGSVWVSGLFGALLLAGAWMFLLYRRRANHLINHLPDTP